MSERDNGGPAFPHPGADWKQSVIWPANGMTLRDYFAAQAMLPTFMALETIKASPGVRYSEADLADGAYKFADAMLAERAKAEEPQ